MNLPAATLVRESHGVTLALGGGGARGIAHLGVMEVLRGLDFKIEKIVGVSSGAIAGALYAFDPDIRRVQQRLLDYLESDEFARHQEMLSTARPAENGQNFSWYQRVKEYLRARRILRRVISDPSILPGIVLRQILDDLLPEADIADARIPLGVVAVDLLSGRQVVLEHGPLRDAVRASCSLPGIFPPVKYREMLLCDVGTFYSLPTTVARSYNPDCLLAVDVSSRIKPCAECETALDVLLRIDEVGEAIFRTHVRDVADMVVCPEVAGVQWFDLAQPVALLEAGRQAMRAAATRLIARTRVPVFARLRHVFEHDGELPGVCISGISAAEVRQIVAWIRERSETRPGAETLRDGNKAESEYADEGALLAAYCACVTGFRLRGISLPDLGMFVYGDRLELFYRGGPQWGAAQVETLFDTLAEIKRLAPGARIELDEPQTDPEARQFQATFDELLDSLVLPPPPSPVLPLDGSENLPTALA